MPLQTDNLDLPYPTGGDSPDGPGAVAALATAIDAIAGSISLSYYGTVRNENTPGHNTAIWRNGRSVHLLLNTNVGANGIDTGTHNYIAHTDLAPVEVVNQLLPVYDGTQWLLTPVLVQWGTDGNVVCLAGSVPANGGIFGLFTGPAS